ncbi:bifunctional diguanylate cyclase/phosphodiesterase [Pararhodospirillum photometricum]|nr:EAL domain-containing protein [Pararhodospirillum photometricum]
MVKVFTERTLPALQVLGMLGTTLIIALGLGTWSITSFTDYIGRTLDDVEAQAHQEQEALLDRQVSSLLAQLEQQRTTVEASLKSDLRAQTSQAVSIAQTVHDQLRGTLPEAKVRQIVLESLRPLRFSSGRGYAFVLDRTGTILLHPVEPGREGGSGLDIRDPQGGVPVRQILSPPADGFVRYLWTPSGWSEARHKISHVRPFAPYDWLIGVGDTLEAVDDDIRSRALPQVRAVHFGTSGAVLVLAAEPDRELAALAPGLSPSRLDADEAWLRRQPGGEALIQRIRSALASGERSLTLDLPDPSGHPPSPRLVRLGLFKPWNWILVASIDLADVTRLVNARRAALEHQIVEHRKTLGEVIIFVLLGAGGVAAGVGGWMNRLLTRYRNDLEQRSAALAESERKLRLSARVFESASDAVVITDTRNLIVAVNPSFTRMTGHALETLRGRSVMLLVSDRHDIRFLATLRRTLRENGGWAGEVWIRRADGSVFLSGLAITLAREPDGRVTHHIGTFADITDRKAAEERIRQLAYFDPLTQLPNRLLLRSRLTQALAAAQRLRINGAVLFIDLDNFKTLNDTRGHDIGDKLLIEVARRLRDTVRERDLVARLGGDEFVVILPHLDPDGAEAATQVERVAEKILNALNLPCEIEGTSHVITPSIGACLFPNDNDSVDTVLKHADTAMYQAKARGRNRLSFFEPAIQDALMRRSRLEADLRAAVTREEFTLYYQPQVDHTGTLVGAEVLVRWNHPHAGLVPPGEFIPLAEETSLIGPIGRQVLEQACSRIAHWNSLGLGQSLTIAVNVSAVQFRDPTFVTQVLDLLSRHGIDPSRLKLELTESLILDDVQGSIVTMNRLKAEGVGFSMDDFGTGYSSLSYLKRLPLDQLKIDRSFVEDVTTDPNDAVIVRTIIAMSRSLGLDVLAEGVERPEQRAFLVANGCQVFQGYLFSPPVDTSTFEAMLTGRIGFVPSRR